MTGIDGFMPKCVMPVHGPPSLTGPMQRIVSLGKVE